MSAFHLLSEVFPFFGESLDTPFSGLSLAMGRDGSSGGVVRLCIVDSKGSERRLITGDGLPFPLDSGK